MRKTHVENECRNSAINYKDFEGKKIGEAVYVLIVLPIQLFFPMIQDDSLSVNVTSSSDVTCRDSDLTRSTIVPASLSPFDWEHLGTDNRRHSFGKFEASGSKFTKLLKTNL